MSYSIDHESSVDRKLAGNEYLDYSDLEIGKVKPKIQKFYLKENIEDKFGSDQTKIFF